tara:strand:- start:486 stop:731 length:246 start_codon:yes stop_codon:yes gene_type:complete
MKETTEFTNKYDMNNPYYTDEREGGIKNPKEVINNRLAEIDEKDINYLEKQAQRWGKTLIDKDLLIKLQDFDFWKEWKHPK